MPTCESFVGRSRCAALAEPGQRSCVFHLKASGYTRCEQCRGWMPPQGLNREKAIRCATCKGEPE